MAATLANNALIDPSKHAEYPIILSDRLSGKDPSRQDRLININYNYKSKSAPHHSTITHSPRARDLYNLTISDKTSPAEQNPLTYSYEGSVDPEQQLEQNLVLVFDPNRKAFVLEPVSTQLNFNLRSSSGKPDKHAIENYTQLRTLQNEDHGAGNGNAPDNTAEDDGPPDESNPYDFRHFLPKSNGPDEKPASDPSTYPQSETSKANSPLTPSATKPSSSVKPRPKPQANPPRQKKNTTKPTNKGVSSAPKPTAKRPEPLNVEKANNLKSPSSDSGTGALLSQKPTPSPGSNIIIDGDLIIDMGSPPPSRPAFKVNPAHFSSNNTPSNVTEEDDDEDKMETLRLPSPASRSGPSAPTRRAEISQIAPQKENEVEDDDGLAAEMEAAFEQSAREEEEARSRQYQQPQSQQRHVPSDDESEVSEEE